MSPRPSIANSHATTHPRVVMYPFKYSVVCFGQPTDKESPIKYAASREAFGWFQPGNAVSSGAQNLSITYGTVKGCWWEHTCLLRCNHSHFAITFPSKNRRLNHLCIFGEVLKPTKCEYSNVVDFGVNLQASLIVTNDFVVGRMPPLPLFAAMIVCPQYTIMLARNLLTLPTDGMSLRVLSPCICIPQIVLE